jgi:tRNA threonylcarbamoyladenosine biosynthesis protein TsaB
VLVLSVDTATSLVVVSLHDGSTLVAGEAHPARQSHAEVLAPLVERVLADVDRSLLTHVVAGVGPGPFTGLRVGIVTAEVLAHAWGIPALGLCSLDAVARAATAATPSLDDFTVLTDARRREVYAASYSGGRRIDGPIVSAPGALPAGVYVGEGAALYAEVLGHDGDPVRMTPLSLGEIAVDAARSGGLPMTPLYLRRPDATEPSAPKSVLGSS